MFRHDFFWYYNDEHRHSGIATRTPASAHDGFWAAVEARRAATLCGPYQTPPERFRLPPGRADRLAAWSAARRSS